MSRKLLEEKAIGILFVFRLFENSCIVRRSGNTPLRFCGSKSFLTEMENITIYQEPKPVAA